MDYCCRTPKGQAEDQCHHSADFHDVQKSIGVQPEEYANITPVNALYHGVSTSGLTV